MDAARSAGYADRLLVFHELQQPLAYRANVLPHGAFGRVAGALIERLDDGIVVICGGAARKVVTVPARQPDLVLDVAQDRAEIRVAGGLRQQRVEPHVLLNIVRLVIGLQQHALPLEALAQFPQQRRRDIGRADHVRFQRFASVVEFVDLDRREPSQVGAFARLDANQALGLQTVERLADGRLADAKLVGQEILGQPRRVVEPALQDVFPDAVIGQRREIAGYIDLLHAAPYQSTVSRTKLTACGHRRPTAPGTIRLRRAAFPRSQIPDRTIACLPGSRSAGETEAR